MQLYHRTAFGIGQIGLLPPPSHKSDLKKNPSTARSAVPLPFTREVLTTAFRFVKNATYHLLNRLSIQPDRQTAFRSVQKSRHSRPATSANPKSTTLLNRLSIRLYHRTLLVPCRKARCHHLPRVRTKKCELKRLSIGLPICSHLGSGGKVCDYYAATSANQKFTTLLNRLSIKPDIRTALGIGRIN